MEKIDHYDLLKHLYQPSAKAVSQVNVPPMNFIMIDGEGDPNTAQEYKDALQALYSVAYTVKFMLKKGPLAVDFRVMPLEGLWWAEDMSDFLASNKANWKWTMMIMQPEPVTREIVEEGVKSASKKGLVSLHKVRFEMYDEGTSAQLMHIGPFSAEGPNIQKVHAYIQERGSLRGRHHEIYLSDINRAAPEKWKTVIRQPFNPLA